MPIVITCPSCKAKLKAPDNAVGKKVKCPGCSEAITVRAPAAAPPRQEDDFEVIDEQEDERPRKPAKSREDDFEEEEDLPRKPAAYMGVGFDPDTDDLEIQEVYEKSPAAKARLNVGDVILRLDGKKVSKRSDLAAFLHKRKPGDEITLEVQGEDEDVEVEIKLGKRP